MIVLTQPMMKTIVDPDTIILFIGYVDTHYTNITWLVAPKPMIMIHYLDHSNVTIHTYLRPAEFFGMAEYTYYNGDDELIIYTDTSAGDMIYTKTKIVHDPEQTADYNNILTLVEDFTQQSIEKFTNGHFHYLEIVPHADKDSVQ